MVEFALTMPLLLLLIFGVIDGGRAALAMVTLTNGVRDGGRVGALAYPSPSWAQQATDRARLSLLAVNQAELTLSTSSESTGGVTHVTVRADYTFRPLGLPAVGGLTPVSLSASARMLVGQLP